MTEPPLLQDLYREIQPHLQAVEAEMRAAMETSRPPIAPLVEHLRGYGGKRLRPALVLIISKAAGAVVPGPRLCRLGAVVEMIHLATLVHDDVIDEACLRRRQETVNSHWSNYDAVLLGDIVFTRAIHLLARLDDTRALRTLTLAVSTLCEGEILQNQHRHDWELLESSYYEIIEAKTAVLYAAAAELAAYLAGASEETTQAFRCFGMELGKAFQIVDDCLDLTGTERDVGKSLRTDVRLGKMTLPLLFLRSRASGEEQDLLRRVIGSKTPDAMELARLQRLLKETGVVEEAIVRAREHAREAVDAIRSLVDGTSLAILEAIAAFVFLRNL